MFAGSAVLGGCESDTWREVERELSTQMEAMRAVLLSALEKGGK